MMWKNATRALHRLDFFQSLMFALPIAEYEFPIVSQSPPQ